MTLNEYMKNNEMTDEMFARRIGVTRSAVTYYRSSLRMPSPRVMLMIEQVTDNQVTAQDMMKEVMRVKQSLQI
jgi:DNA-binding transcriptional regulator YdaS (Cro superfamily)